MAIIFTQTDNAATFEVGCSAVAAGATTAGREIIEGGTAGVTEVSVDPGNNTEASVLAFRTTGGLGLDTWAAGDYVVRLNISGANGTSVWSRTYICERTSGGAFNAVASLTGQTTDVSATGIVSHTVNRGTDFTPVATDSDLFIVVVLSNSDQHGNSSTSITPDQNIDTPLVSQEPVVAGLGLLQETESSESISAEVNLSANVSPVIESEFSESISAEVGLSATVDPVQETETAESITPAETLEVAVGPSTETESSEAISAEVDLSSSVDPVTESEFSESISAEVNLSATVNPVEESESAETISAEVDLSVDVGAVRETETSESVEVSADSTVDVGPSEEIESSGSIEAVSAITVSVIPVTETESSEPVTVASDLSATVGPSVENESAEAVSAEVDLSVDVASVEESETSEPVTAGVDLSVDVGPSEETELAENVNPSVGATLEVSPADETETSQAISAEVDLSVEIAASEEVESAEPVTAGVDQSILVLPVHETESSEVVLAGVDQSVFVSSSEENETAESVEASVRISAEVGAVTESESAELLSIKQDINSNVVPVTETETAEGILAVTPSVAVLGSSGETESAESIEGSRQEGLLVSVGNANELETAVSRAIKVHGGYLGTTTKVLREVETASTITPTVEEEDIDTGKSFYHSLIRKYIIAFGNLFNDIAIERLDSSGTRIQTVHVPIAYGPKQHWLVRLRQDPDFRRGAAVQLPRIGFEMVSMNYASERKITSTKRAQKITIEDPNKVRWTYFPVPYDIQFTMSIMVKNAEDGARIVEQILPYFTPEWTVNIELVPDTGIFMDIPYVLQDVSIEDTYEQDFMDRRALIWNIDFNCKAWFFGPQRTSGIIKRAQVDLHSTLDGARNSRVVVTPGLTANGEPTEDPDESVDYLSVEADDDYGFASEVSFFSDGRTYDPETGKDLE